MRLLLDPPHKVFAGFVFHGDGAFILPAFWRYKWYRDVMIELYRETGFAIVDNGVYEGEMNFLQALEIADVLWAAKPLGTIVVVLPDVIGDEETTLKLSRNALQYVPPKYQAMYVVQGKTSWRKIKDYAKWFGVPIWMDRKRQGSRIPVVRQILMETEARVHLLGLDRYSELYELWWNVGEKEWNRLSIDTSLPFTLAWHGRKAKHGVTYSLGRPKDPLRGRLTQRRVRLVAYNVGKLRRYCTWWYWWGQYL